MVAACVARFSSRSRGGSGRARPGRGDNDSRGSRIFSDAAKGERRGGGPRVGAVSVATTAPTAQRFSTLDLLSAPFVRGNRWLLFFLFLFLTQGGHVLEHLIQMVQIHVLGLPGKQAQGLVGAALNIEWVHLAWNTWVILAIVALLVRYRGNRWLWVAAVFAGWHEFEHLFIIWIYIQTGVPGEPGLLSQGGAIAGGLPLSRPDLHFLYNLIETVPLACALTVELRRLVQPKGPAPSVD